MQAAGAGAVRRRTCEEKTWIGAFDHGWGRYCVRHRVVLTWVRWRHLQAGSGTPQLAIRRDKGGRRLSSDELDVEIEKQRSPFRSALYEKTVYFDVHLWAASLQRVVN